jgi:hypothetical protein
MVVHAGFEGLLPVSLHGAGRQGDYRGVTARFALAPADLSGGLPATAYRAPDA